MVKSVSAMQSEETAPARPAPDRDKWARNHNERRKKQYDTDPDYRNARLEQSRESYRKQNGVALSSCLSRLHELSAYGEVREVRIGGRSIGKRLCFSMKEFGEIIGDHKAPVIYRWRTKELIPQPIAKAPVFVVTSGRAGAYDQDQSVYLAEEVEAMVKVIGEHQTRLRYYRTKDLTTIRAVHAAVDAARDTLGA